MITTKVHILNQDLQSLHEANFNLLMKGYILIMTCNMKSYIKDQTQYISNKTYVNNCISSLIILTDYHYPVTMSAGLYTTSLSQNAQARMYRFRTSMADSNLVEEENHSDLETTGSGMMKYTAATKKLLTQISTRTTQALYFSVTFHGLTVILIPSWLYI